MNQIVYGRWVKIQTKPSATVERKASAAAAVEICHEYRPSKPVLRCESRLKKLHYPC